MTDTATQTEAPEQEVAENGDEQTEERKPRNPVGKSAFERAGEAGRKLGSRITARQIEAVEGTLENEELTPGKVVKDATLAQLLSYAQSGDREDIGEKAYGQLRAFVKMAQTHEALENDSQRRRLWPRKVAAIIVELAS